jgi:hypothetical protein
MIHMLTLDIVETNRAGFNLRILLTVAFPGGKAFLTLIQMISREFI